jgi:NADPH-dependent 2,4-dienoyl-CoA reductase/sulfur reductase-like enzyme
MPERLIVIGGDAAGMSAASQARRQRPSNDLEILAFERSSWVSYSACGEPYYVGGYVTDLTQLQARTPAEFAARDITVQTRHEAVALDTQAGRVTVRNLETGKDTTLGYDLLMYATGSTAFVPPIAGRELAGVHVLHTLDDAQVVRHLVTAGAQHAVVVGGGYISLEVVEGDCGAGSTGAHPRS